MSDLLREAMNDEAREAAEIDEEYIEAPEEPGVRIAIPDLSFLAAHTGAGTIEEYVDHPLNFDRTKSTARILRGLTGICGELNYALIDIGLGVIEKIKERGHNEQAN